MPQYTTSYSTNKKRPTRRRAAATGQQLPGARRRSVKKPGVQYLHHSQGFGHSNRGRRTSRGSNRRRNPYALIAVGVALLLFVASLIWYANRSVDIELNGSTVSVRINSTLEQLIENQEIDVRAGNLLAVDDTVLTKRGGEKYSVKVGKKQIDNDKLSETTLSGGEKVTISNGRDEYEEHTIEATDIQPGITFEGSGAIQYVKTWCEMGRSEVWTGKTSGKTQDRGVVKEAVDCVIACKSVEPTSGKYVALTFNASPSENTAKLAQILQEKGASATFFFTGDNISGNESQVKAVVNAGCEVASYGMSGTTLANFEGESLRAQISQGLEAVNSASGKTTALVRSAGGKLDETQWATCADLIGAAVAWNLDSGDWLLNGSDTVIETIMSGVSNGNIVTLTDNDETSEQTLELLETLIDRLQAEGYTIVSVSELIKTDEELADAIDMSQASMPKDAVLPTVKTEDDADAASDTTSASTSDDGTASTDVTD